MYVKNKTFVNPRNNKKNLRPELNKIKKPEPRPIPMVIILILFQVPAEGSMFWIFLLTMLQGLCGTTIGLIISAVCKTQQDATQIGR